MGIVNGTVLYNAIPFNGATVKLWPLTSFAAYADSLDEVENDPLAATDIELDVNDGTRFAVGDIIKIESELLRIWLISTNKLYVQRGWRGTTPAAHVQNTQIDDETVTEPAQDDSEPGSGQVGATLTSGVAYGGDGAYRWDDVAEGEYFASVEYGGVRSFFHHLVETDDPTPSQLLTVRGDIFIRGVDGVKRLAKGAASKVLTMGANEPEWGAGAAGATREFFIMPANYHNGANGSLSNMPRVRLSENDEAYFAFKIPHDWTSITNAEVIVVPTATNGTADIDIASTYGAVGEAYNTHSESDVASTYSLTQNQLKAIDVSGILSGIAAGDIIGLTLEMETAEDLDVIGLRFKYA